MQGKPLHPTVPVTLVEFVAGVRVTEESSTLAYLRPERVIKVSSPAGTESLQLVLLPTQLGDQSLAAAQGTASSTPGHPALSVPLNCAQGVAAAA